MKINISYQLIARMLIRQRDTEEDESEKSNGEAREGVKYEDFVIFMVLILTSGGSLQWICYCYICIILEKV
jgi:hypothetical protein